MEGSVIHHRLDLLIRLIDTTTGFEVEERDIHFYEDEKKIFPHFRGSGTYVLINSGRRNGFIRVRAYGYEEAKAEIRYEDMDAVIPICQIFLIPSENIFKGQPVISFTGRLPGISAIEAVSLEPSGCCISGFDERKGIIKLFGTRQVNTENLYYGLIHMKEQTYEKFEVVKELPDPGLKIKEVLREEFSVNSPIARIVFGMVKEDGSYCLRIRDDRQQLLYIVRYVVADKVKFQTVDFRKPEEFQLE